MMRRRRFLQITAAALVLPGAAQAETLWRGRALGADAEVRLTGPADRAAQALAGIASVLERVEATFSLYRPSELTRLNARGHIVPSDWFRQVVQLSDQLHHLTGGAFDPSVQSLWQALATGKQGTGLVGWRHLRVGGELHLAPGQALTFNGVAQGFATDLVRDHLAAAGFDQALVNIGEYAALGGPFRLGIADPLAGMLAEWHVTQAAVAVSSAFGTSVGGQPHILHPSGQPPLWSTVAVEADSAALADGLSTALVFCDVPGIAALKAALPAVRRVAVIDPYGDLRTV